MCGITGFWDFKRRFGASAELATNMAERIRTRGPDSSGAWIDASAGVALAHRRLAISDLSPAGHQPMESPSGRYVMVYNGEVYNDAEIRDELKPHSVSYKGHSDTETILAAFDVWGIESSLKRFVGMFALAIWDKSARTLTLARDRVGIKPLYYGLMNGTWLFGSEIKSLLEHPAFEKNLSDSAIRAFFTFGYVPESECAFKGLRKLTPGTVSVLKGHAETTSVYWSLSEVITENRARRERKSEGEWIEETHALLKDSVKKHTRADVPIGAFLSGGIDSSLVTSLARECASEKIKTFSIGFGESGYNEAPFAREVAERLGTDHHEMCVTPIEAMEVIPKLAEIYDEPFADVSQIPTYLVAKLAGSQVKVVLSGDGGDELFAGYNRYAFGRLIEKSRAYAPGWLRALAGKTPHGVWRALEKFPGVPNQLARKVSTALKILNRATLNDRYRAAVSHWHVYEDMVAPHPELKDPVETFQYLDTLTYLSGDILTKVDRATMAVGLEARVPLLDHRLIELAWKLPMSLKIRGVKGKYVLREILRRHVPSECFERPKMGFGVPIDSWLRRELAPLVNDLLFASPLDEFGISRKDLEACLAKHRSGNPDTQHELWAVLTFQLWRERYFR